MRSHCPPLPGLPEGAQSGSPPDGAHPGMGCRQSQACGPPRPGPDSAVAPALPSLLCQGLGLCQHGLPVHAGRLPAALRREEEAAPGHVGRCEGRPSWGRSGQVAGGVPAAARCRRPGPGLPARPSGPPPRPPQPPPRGPGFPIQCARGQGPAADRPTELSAGSPVSGWRSSTGGRQRRCPRCLLKLHDSSLAPVIYVEEAGAERVCHWPQRPEVLRGGAWTEPVPSPHVLSP